MDRALWARDKVLRRRNSCESKGRWYHQGENTACAFCATAFVSLLHATIYIIAMLTSTEMGEETSSPAQVFMQHH